MFLFLLKLLKKKKKKKRIKFVALGFSTVFQNVSGTGTANAITQKTTRHTASWISLHYCLP